MKRIALITGGYGAEREISLLSARNIAQYIDTDRYDVHEIDVLQDRWEDKTSGVALDMNDGSIMINGTHVRFDYALIILHGTPAEDGKMQGILERWGVAYSSCDTFVSALTFRKFQCNVLLSHYGIRSPHATLIRRDSIGNTSRWEDARYPLFVKPNANGSSYGIQKVINADEMVTAISNAMVYDDEVVVEQGIEGREFTCGAIRTTDGLRVLPITEIKTNRIFFDYEAKYEGANEEITPADLSPELTERCQAITRRIYEKLGCRGPIRADFMMKDDLFYLIEVNTIPGLTETSLLPQQVVADGWSMADFVEEWISMTSTHVV